MPITIRPSVVKIKKPSTGEYREINALLDTDSAKTVYYGVSSTAAATQTKTVTIEGISALSDGLLVRILFANAQSYSGVPKLMINSTAASNIKTRRGTDATGLTWKAGDVLDFVYDSSSSGFIVLDKGDIKDLNSAIKYGTLLNGMPQYEMALPSNADFNNYTTAGTYYVISDGDARTMSHMPYQASGTLYVINRAAGSYKTQIYMPTTGVNLIYTRLYNAGNWTDWVLLATDNWLTPIEAETKDIKKSMVYTDGTNTTVSVANGSVTNPSSQQAVATVENLAIKSGQVATVKVLRRPKSESDYFVYGYQITYNGTQIAYQDYTTNTVSPKAQCNYDGGPTCYVRFTIAESNGTTFTPLRATDFKTGDVIITIENAPSTVIDAQPRVLIPSGANLNDYKMAGSYYVASDSAAANITNIPRNASGALYVLDRGDSGYYLMQMYIPTSSYQIIYTRFRNASSWTSWAVRGEMVVHTGTVTTSAAGTALFAEEYNSSSWMCLSVVAANAVDGYVLIPYKWRAAAGGAWGLKACDSGDLSPKGNEAINYIALMYRYK